MSSIFELADELESEQRQHHERPRRNRDVEAGQTAVVLDYLRRHPWSEIPQIRDGIQGEGGPYIERVQRCLDDLKETFFVDDRPASKGRKAYRLGDRRTAPRGQEEIRFRLGREVDAATVDRIRREVQPMIDEILVRLDEEARREDVEALVDVLADLRW